MRSRPLPEHGALSHSERRQLDAAYREGPAAYGSIASLVRSTNLPRHKVLNYLHGKKAYTKFKLPRRKFTRLGVMAKYINEIWCLDLAHMDKLSTENQGVKYLLVAVDVLSRFVRVQPLKDKTANATKQAFIKMLGSDKPSNIWVDDGTEFEASFKRYCKDLSIKIYHTFSDTKAAYAERAIRSLKNTIYRYMEESESSRYVHKLPQLVKSMNSRINRSIGKPPKDFTNKDALPLMLESLKFSSKPKFRVSDHVRISKKDIPFRKGYKPQFTNEIFKIVKVVTTNPPTYSLQDRNGEIIRGKFYEQELVKYTT